VAGQQRHLLGRGHVQHVDPPAGPARQAQQPRGGPQRRLLVAPDRVLVHVGAAAHQGQALAQPILVLGVHRDAPPAGAEHRQQGLVVLDQQAAGGRAHEDLHPAAAGQGLQPGQLFDVLGRRADEEGVIDPGPALGPGELVGERLGVQRARPGVGHLENRGDTAQRGRRRAAGQVLLVLHAGLAEVDLGVDDPRQDMQARGLDGLRRFGAHEVADLRDAPAGHRQVGPDQAAWRRQRPAPDNQIVVLAHPLFPSETRHPPCADAPGSPFLGSPEPLDKGPDP
jgi:hypothetical protein